MMMYGGLNMEPWDIVKERLLPHVDKFNRANWIQLYKYLKHNFMEVDLEEYANHEDPRICKLVVDLNMYKKGWEIRKDFNNIVTVKLSLPGRCNAVCTFCYHKGEVNVCNSTVKESFLDAFTTSLCKILDHLEDMPASLDITGYEPTMDIVFLDKVLNKLRNFHRLKEFKRVTLTTNGFGLFLYPVDLKGVVDYVNVSIHHYEAKERRSIMGTYTLDLEYEQLAQDMADMNIDVSAVAVVHKKINNFPEYLDKFIEWCKTNGYISLRIRHNAFAPASSIDTYSQKDFNKYMQYALDTYTVIQQEESADSTWCRVVDNDGFQVFFLAGVLDTSDNSIGIEYVVAGDGKAYLDHGCNTELIDSPYPGKYILDRRRL